MYGKKFISKIVILILLLFSYSCFATTQPYKDKFYIKNFSKKTIQVKYKESKILVPSYAGIEQYGFDLDIGEKRTINVQPGFFYYDGGYEILTEGDSEIFAFYTHSNKKYYKMGWFARFLLISGELIVKDEDGNILMTLDTITPEDFEVTEEAGITTATLIIRDK